ncbi:MAG TPA: YfhO family protein [Thermoanaerobaculia bacterium]|nr:YfhO family protein [Thermoanaerobaculia bacterium]
MRRLAAVVLLLLAAGCAPDEPLRFITYPHAHHREDLTGAMREHVRPAATGERPQIAVYESDSDLVEVARFYATSYGLGSVTPALYHGAHGLEAVINARPGRPRVILQRPYVDATTGDLVDRTLIVMTAAEAAHPPVRGRGANVSWLLVLAVYAAAVWLARRAGIDLPRRIAALFYLLTFLFLRPGLTQDVVNLPVDYLRTLPPWSHLTRDHHVINSEMNDLVLQIVPWAHQVRESWRSFEAPLWNHLSGGGYPLLANAQSAALSPLRILALPLSLGQSFAAEAAMKILIALTFTYLFCRRRGYAEIASAAGAIAFGFSSFVLVWLHFPMATAAVYLPAALYMVDLIAERRTFGRIAFAAGLWAAILFAGHPETAAHTFFISLLYVLWITLAERRFVWREALRFIGALCLALALAAMLAAPFLAPFADNLTKSKRYQELQGGAPHGWYFSDWPSFVVLLQPRFYGDIPIEKAWGPAHAEAITGFSGILGIAGWFTVLLQVIVRRRWRSPELFFVIVAGVVLLALFDIFLFGDLFTSVFHLAANTRLRLIYCFMLALLTAGSLDLVMKGERRLFLLGLFAAAGILGYLLWSTNFPHAWDRDTAVIALLPSVVVLALAAAVPFARRWKEIALMLVMVAIIGELWTLGRKWMPNIREELFYPTTPLLEALADLRQRQPPNEPFRIVGTGPTFFPNLSAMYGFEEVRAHDPMAGGRYVGVLRVLTGYDTDDYFPKWEDLESGLLDFLNVRYVLTPRGGELDDRERFHLLYDGRDGRIYENTTALPRVFPIRNVVLEFRDDVFARRLKDHRDWHTTAMLETLLVENDRMRNDLLAPRPHSAPEATTSILSATPTRLRIRVDAPRYSMVGTSISWFSGWKVRTGGQTLHPLRINGTFLGFAVPPGVHEVEVFYRPRLFRVGVGVSVMTALGLAVFGLRRRFG